MFSAIFGRMAINRKWRRSIVNENVAASTARARGLRHLVLAVGIAVLCALCIGLVGCGGPSPTDVTKQAIEAVKA